MRATVPTLPAATPVRIGAGMRRQAAAATVGSPSRRPPLAAPAAMPAAPARVADAGRVRLGAGMRRG